MKMILLLMITIIMVACGDNGMSAPSEVCYDKKIGYTEVATQYSQYQEEWISGACLQKIENDCAMYDRNYTITIRECAENVEFH